MWTFLILNVLRLFLPASSVMATFNSHSLDLQMKFCKCPHSSLTSLTLPVSLKVFFTSTILKVNPPYLIDWLEWSEGTRIRDNFFFVTLTDITERPDKHGEIISLINIFWRISNTKFLLLSYCPCIVINKSACHNKLNSLDKTNWWIKEL